MGSIHFGLPSALAQIYSGLNYPSLQATRVLVACWCIMSCLEWIANYRLFEDGGLLTWRVLSLRPGYFFRHGIAERLVGRKAIVLIVILRLLAGLALLAISNVGVTSALLLILVATYWLILERSWLGADGSDQMGQIVSTGALLLALGLHFDNQLLSLAGTLWMGGQLILSYFASGFSKLLSPTWRSGKALVGVMNTHSHGHKVAARIACDSPRFAQVLCWAIILGETLFPLCIAAPIWFLAASLCAFMFFHLSNAYFMGLNLFVWSFPATYPSVLLIGVLVNAYLRHGS